MRRHDDDESKTPEMENGAGQPPTRAAGRAPGEKKAKGSEVGGCTFERPVERGKHPGPRGPFLFAHVTDAVNNDRVFIDGLITTTKSVHVYDPENSFGKAAKNHMKFVPRVNDHGRHSAACILGCVHDAAFFQSPTAYNGSADGQPIQLEQNGSFFRSVCRLYVIDRGAAAESTADKKT